MKTNWWLAEQNIHGYVSELRDGPHDSIEGVEQALYLFQRLGFAEGRKFVAAKVQSMEVEAKPHDSNEDALNRLNSIGLSPPTGGES